MKKLVFTLAALALFASVGLKSAPAMHAAPAVPHAPLTTCSVPHWAEETWSGWHADGSVQQATLLFLSVDASNNYCGKVTYNVQYQGVACGNSGVTADTYTYVNGVFSPWYSHEHTAVGGIGGSDSPCSVIGAIGPAFTLPAGDTVYFASYGNGDGMSNFGTGTGWYTIP